VSCLQCDSVFACMMAAPHIIFNITTVSYQSFDESRTRSFVLRLTVLDWRHGDHDDRRHGDHDAIATDRTRRRYTDNGIGGV